MEKHFNQINTLWKDVLMLDTFNFMNLSSLRLMLVLTRWKRFCTALYWNKIKLALDKVLKYALKEKSNLKGQKCNDFLNFTGDPQHIIPEIQTWKGQ